jgi:hypothetical protein
MSFLVAHLGREVAEVGSLGRPREREAGKGGDVIGRSQVGSTGQKAKASSNDGDRNEGKVRLGKHSQARKSDFRKNNI